MLLIIILESCHKEKIDPVAFSVKNIPMPRALSKEASGGKALLSGHFNYAYELETPFFPMENSSVEITYSLDTGGSSSSPDAPLVISFGANSWELPVKLSFLDGMDISDRIKTAREIIIKYVIPLTDESIKKIAFSYSGPEKDSCFIFTIKSVAITGRWFGFSAKENDAGIILTLSPYVFTRDASLIIDPPSSCLPANGYEFSAVSDAKAVSLSAGKLRFNSQTYNLNVPAVYLNDENFPLVVFNSKTIKEASLVPARNLPFPLPIPADPGLILSWPREAWRDSRLEIFSMENYPSILIFDMGDYDIQEKFLKRIAFYTEKAGYRGKLATHEQIADLYAWNAHDYNAESLADFFYKIRLANMALSDEERELEIILFRNGIIKRGADGSIIPGEGAVLSISRESPAYLRETFMVHEVFHGLFFIDEAFRNFSYKRWDSLEEPCLHFFRAILKYRITPPGKPLSPGYDTTDTYLMINEYMSYLLQQNLSQTESYFKQLFSNTLLNLSPWDRSSVSQVVDIYKKDAAAFSDYVSRRWGYEAGRVKSVTVKRN